MEKVRSAGVEQMHGQRRLPPRRPHPADARTEIIPSLRDEPTEYIPVYHGGGDQYGDDQYDDYDDDVDDGYVEPKRRRTSPGVAVVRTIGELLITSGLVVLLFVVYEVWITDLISAGKQDDVTNALEQQWHDPAVPDPERAEHFAPANGDGIAKLYIPALGSDYKFTVVQGTSEDNLAVGPGHYTDSAAPGAPGNFAVAGHRVGKGSPFNDLDLLAACDAIVVETRGNWYVYRLLPTADEAKKWAERGTDPKCAGVNGSTKVEPMTGPYAAAVGRRIVSPHESSVVAPVPGNVAAKIPVAAQRKMITLTTCHPKFSNRQRMILHGVLVRAQAKNPADASAIPAELGEV
jgi:sortase (surface protein transpeptidase)